MKWVLNRVWNYYLLYKDRGYLLCVNKVASNLRLTPEWVIWAIVELDISGFVFDNMKTPYGSLQHTEQGEFYEST